MKLTQVEVHNGRYNFKLTFEIGSGIERVKNVWVFFVVVGRYMTSWNLLAGERIECDKM